MLSSEDKKFPISVAIIMDGNGRWAQEKGMPRVKGHEKGAQVVKEITTEAVKRGIKELTLYSLSWDNLNRPQEELAYLFTLFRIYLNQEKQTVLDNNIKFKVIGRRETLPEDIVKEIENLEQLSALNNGLVLRLAVSYSGKMEILDAVNRILNTGSKDLVVNEENFRKFLYDPQMLYPDLLIRTGGEYRVSDFLLWHIAYTEFWFTSVYWPDFTIDLFHQALEDYTKRKRRFGRTCSQT
jgi:undecaprenyl diphosphate synthase